MTKPARRRVVIVGASAAGLKCACRLTRLQPSWRITVVEEQRAFSYAACGLPYVLAGDVEDAERLRKTQDGALRDPTYFARVKGIEVLAPWRAEGVDPAARTLTLVEGGERRQLEWDELVLACGAEPRRLPGQPNHPRVRSFHRLEDLAPLSQGLASGSVRTVTVVGAGPLGCELADAFRGLWGAQVTLVEQAAWPLPAMLDADAGAIVAAVLADHGVALRLSTTVEKIEADATGATVLLPGERLRADVVVVAVGVTPRVELAVQAGVALGASGAIAVDQRGATSVPHLWAVGDCVEVRHAITGGPTYLPLGSLANREGRVVANVLAGIADALPPVVGAMAVKVFGCQVAAAGLTLAQARRLGLDAAASWLVSHDRAHYWPEAQELAVQLTYERGSERLLGVQCVGAGEAVARVDVATQFLARGATVAELSHLEHAYAPPFAPALEPLAVAAWVARNQEDGVVAAPPGEDLENAALLDVRHDEERRRHGPAAARTLAIPLEELRDRRGEVGSGPYLVICERGGRAAEAVRWLRREGVTARYLGGGLRWRSVGRERGGP